MAPSPLAAVLEVSGAVLSWTVDDPAADAQITFTEFGPCGLAVAGARRDRAPRGRLGGRRRHT